MSLPSGFARPLESIAAEPNGRDYLRWMLTKDFPTDVKAICRAALDGKFPKPAPAPEPLEATT